MTVRTRFAPSPTGYLHVGGARTALYCWLYARKQSGQFVLRIEDTDRERSTEASVQVILDGMAWLGLEHDEGPFYQTKRFDRYKALTEQLLAENKAYRCYCSKERLEQLREEQMASKQKPRYDGHCRDLPRQDGAHVIRFKNPLDGEVVIDDHVCGQVVIANQELDDLIIARTDGTPTYNFTVVVDDADMGITHVIRGADHLNNTPRQINIFKALNLPVPSYSHVPMILGGDGKRLSKRHGAVSVLQYRDDGYLPEALLNYLIRLGWSHGDQEIFSQQEMIDLFDLDAINKAAATFDNDKLDWVNQQYLKTMDPEVVANHLAWQFEHLGIDSSTGPALRDIVEIQCERVKTLREMAEKSRYFYEPVTAYDEKAAKKNLKSDAAPILTAMIAGLDALPAWNKAAIHDVVAKTTEALDVKMGKVAQPIRVAVTGNTVSPSIDVTLYLLGKDHTLSRLKQALTFINKKIADEC